MHMIDLRLDAGRLARYMGSIGNIGPRDLDEDYGYAAHAWLFATFGEMAPKPFRVIDKNGLRLLAYSSYGIEDLKVQAGLVAEPAAFSVCNWDASASKEIPTDAFVAGRTFNFEVRACPMSRSDAGEKDLFLVEIEYAEKHGKDRRTRDAVYIDWLKKRIVEAGVTDEFDKIDCTLCGFRRVKGIRKTQATAQNASRRSQVIERPDALFSGRITIKDQESFKNLLTHGIGRHRAFGYGMLLIRP
jgi:CRISPR system Cascade subunit CasE